MDLATQLVNAAVVVLIGIYLTYVVRDRARHQEKAFTAQLDAHQAKTDAQVAAIQSQLNANQASMDRQFASVRSDLTQVALAVGAQPRPQAG